MRITEMYKSEIRRDYEKAIAIAWNAYNEAIVAARKACNEALIKAREDYEEAITELDEALFERSLLEK